MNLFGHEHKPSRRATVLPLSRSYRPTLEMLEDRLSPTTGLAAPTITGITAVNISSATVAWSPVANETGYHILLWDGTQATTIATVGPNATTTTIKGLPAGQQVWLRVEAFNATAQADSAWGTVTLPTKPLSGATGLTATAVSAAQVNLNWAPAHGQTGYNVLEWDGTKPVVVATLGAGALHTSIKGLTAGTTYFFSIQAFNETGSTATDWASAITLPQHIAAPTHLTCTATDTQVTLNWLAGQGATGYRVFEWENGQAVQLGQTDATTRTYTVTNLQPGTLYWFYVQAYNPSNTASTAWKSVATTAISNPLQAPGNVTATVVTPGSVQLAWTASTGAAGYLVFQWTGAAWQVVTKPAATDTSATLTGLPTGTTQYFVVMAYTADLVQHTASPIISVTL
jgi:hypothetical protein